jgi:hypothetical protein
MFFLKSAANFSVMTSNSSISPFAEYLSGFADILNGKKVQNQSAVTLQERKNELIFAL